MTLSEFIGMSAVGILSCRKCMERWCLSFVHPYVASWQY